jgi:hypothetical protein
MKIFFTTLLISPALCGFFFNLFVLVKDLVLNGHVDINAGELITIFLGSMLVSYIFVLFQPLLFLLIIYAGVYSFIIINIHKLKTYNTYNQRYIINCSVSVIIGLLIYSNANIFNEELDFSEIWLVEITIPVCIIIGVITTCQIKYYKS